MGSIVEESKERRVKGFFEILLDNPIYNTLFKSMGTIIEREFFDDVKSLSNYEIEYLCYIGSDGTSFYDLNKLILGKDLEDSLNEEDKVDRANMARRLDSMAQKGFVEKIKMTRTVKKFKHHTFHEVVGYKITERGQLARMFHDPRALLAKINDLIDENIKLRAEIKDLKTVLRKK